MRAGFVLLLLAGITACAPDNDVSPANDAVAPAAEATAGTAACEVLTLADAKSALGREHDVQQLDADGGPAGLDICQYGYEGEAMLDTGNVSVTVQPLDLASVKAGAEAQGYTLEPVIGIGDQAYYSPDIGLYVGKGNRTAIYLLGIGGMDPAQTKERSIALARATVARL